MGYNYPLGPAYSECNALVIEQIKAYSMYGAQIYAIANMICNYRIKNSPDIGFFPVKGLMPRFSPLL